MSVLNTEGGWSAILQVPRTRSEEEWAMTLLGERDVLIQPGFFYDFESEAFLVVSLLTETATLPRALRGFSSLALAVGPSPGPAAANQHFPADVIR